jgi:hypothetical protein
MTSAALVHLNTDKDACGAGRKLVCLGGDIVFADLAGAGIQRKLPGCRCSHLGRTPSVWMMMPVMSLHYAKSGSRLGHSW